MSSFNRRSRATIRTGRIFFTWLGSLVSHLGNFSSYPSSRFASVTAARTKLIILSGWTNCVVFRGLSVFALPFSTALLIVGLFSGPRYLVRIHLAFWVCYFQPGAVHRGCSGLCDCEGNEAPRMGRLNPLLFPRTLRPSIGFTVLDIVGRGTWGGLWGDGN